MKQLPLPYPVQKLVDELGYDLAERGVEIEGVTYEDGILEMRIRPPFPLENLLKPVSLGLEESVNNITERETTSC